MWWIPKTGQFLINSIWSKKSLAALDPSLEEKREVEST